MDSVTSSLFNLEALLRAAFKRASNVTTGMIGLTIICACRDIHRTLAFFPVVSRQLHKITLPIAHQGLCGAVHQVIVSPIRESSAFLHHLLCTRLIRCPDHTSFKQRRDTVYPR